MKTEGAKTVQSTSEWGGALSQAGRRVIWAGRTVVETTAWGCFLGGSVGLTFPALFLMKASIGGNEEISQEFLALSVEMVGASALFGTVTGLYIGLISALEGRKVSPICTVV